MIPETSVTLTISLVTFLQLVQTPPHATTLLLSGHEFSEDSIIITTSRNNSSGMSAQFLFSKSTFDSVLLSSWTTRCGRDLISRITVLSDIIGRRGRCRLRSENRGDLERWLSEVKTGVEFGILDWIGSGRVGSRDLDLELESKRVTSYFIFANYRTRLIEEFPVLFGILFFCVVLFSF